MVSQELRQFESYEKPRVITLWFSGLNRRHTTEYLAPAISSLLVDAFKLARVHEAALHCLPNEDTAL
jgi:hypothetical protein